MNGQLYRIHFEDGNILRDEDGNTEFSIRRAEYFRDRLIDHVAVEIKPYDQTECEK